MIDSASFHQTVGALRAAGRWFREGPPVFIARAPGRLDLMGGNVDYTGGRVFETTIREATWAAVQLRGDSSIVLVNPQMRERGWADVAEFALADLTDEDAVRQLVNRDPLIRWTAYVLGIFFFLRAKYPEAVHCGATLYIASDVPMNKGVSSSAAVEVAAMKAAAAAYGVPMAGIELSEWCQWVENAIAQSPCGIMDQATVAMGQRGYLLPLLCQPCQIGAPVRLPALLECRAIDSGVTHSVSGMECEMARAAAFMGYKMICDWEELPVNADNSGRIPRWTDPRWNGYLSNLSPSQFRASYESRLPVELSGADYLHKHKAHVDPFTPLRAEANYLVRAAARYAVEENHRIHTFIELAGGAGGAPQPEAAFELMGELMYQSHHSYTECGLGSQATDYLVSLVRGEGPGAGLYGAKITGGGAGGTVAVLGRADAHKAFQRVVANYAEFSGAMPHIFEGSSDGADRFGVQTI